MNTDELKALAKSGDASAQYELSHAYLEGNGVLKNRNHYLSWLIKAAEQNIVEAQKELVMYYSDKKNKNADVTEARRWANKAKTNGVVFSDEILLKIGDAEKCKEKVEEYLFGSRVQFDKAKLLILKNRPSEDVIKSWAEKYHANNKGNKNRVGEIVYMYLISTNGDSAKMNNIALRIIEENEKDNIKIAIALFKEACRLGNQYAAASYLYCLLVGKGVRKNIRLAASIYFEYKDKGIELSEAFVGTGSKGRKISIPTSIEWRKEKTKLKLGKYATVITSKFLVPCDSLFQLPNEYWTFKHDESVRQENEAIAAEVAKGNWAAADGCKDGGCTESIMAGQRVLFGYLGIFSLVLAVIIALWTGHIPNWLVYTIGVLFFYPSLYGIEGKVSASFVSMVPLSILGYGVYFACGLDWNYIMASTTIGSAITSLLMFLVILFISVYGFFLSNLLMGFWFHYLVAIEWKYGSFKAFFFAVISLVLTFGGGCLLYENGIIF